MSILTRCIDQVKLLTFLKLKTITKRYMISLLLLYYKGLLK
jgi:hypothetical protein